MPKQLYVRYTDNTRAKSRVFERTYGDKQQRLFRIMFGQEEDYPSTARYLTAVSSEMSSSHSNFQKFVNRLQNLIDNQSDILIEEIAQLLQRQVFKVRSISDLILLKVYATQSNTSNIYLGHIEDTSVYVHDVVWFYNLSFIFIDERYKIDAFEITEVPSI